MLIHLLVHNSAQNNPMKGGFEGSLFVALEGALGFSFRKNLKFHKRWKRVTFDVIIDGPRENAIEGAF